jgi:hypothetical protein
VHAQAIVGEVVVEEHHAAGLVVLGPAAGKERTGFVILAEVELGEKQAFAIFLALVQLGSVA